jgi:hypothetical protein
MAALAADLGVGRTIEMTRLGRRRAWLISGVYGYWSLFVASWWLWISSTQNEAWFDTFSRVATVLFFPLVAVTFGLCRLAWGSWSLFEAHLVFGLLTDVTVASLLAVTAFAFVVVRWRARPRVEPL